MRSGTIPLTFPSLRDGPLPLPQGERCEIPDTTVSLLLVIPRLRMAAAGRAAMLGDADARGDVAELVVDQANAHQRRGLPDRADVPLLVDDDLPDLLRDLEALIRLLAGGRAEEIIDLQDVGVGRLRSLRAVRGVPDGEGRSHIGLGRVDRDGMAREEVE